MFRRLVLAVAFSLSLGVVGPLAPPAQACPMCKIANEQDSRLPQAYMYSILFMMGMIFSIGGGIGFGMYLLSRRENAAVDGWQDVGADAEQPNSNGLLPGGLQPATT